MIPCTATSAGEDFTVEVKITSDEGTGQAFMQPKDVAPVGKMVAEIKTKTPNATVTCPKLLLMKGGKVECTVADASVPDAPKNLTLLFDDQCPRWEFHWTGSALGFAAREGFSTGRKKQRATGDRRQATGNFPEFPEISRRRSPVACCFFRRF